MRCEAGTASGDACGNIPDAAPSDAPPSDAPEAAQCPASGVTNVGAPSSFQQGSPTYFSSGNFFVMRDANGLYALTAVCTHQGCTVRARTSTFYCPCHGATFSLNGAVVSGPVFQPLRHYLMCQTADGNLGVVRNQQVSASTRLNL